MESAIENLPLILAIGGRKRHGKGTLIRTVQTYLEGPHTPRYDDGPEVWMGRRVWVTQWALPLKRLAMDMYGLSWAEVQGIEYDREQPHPRLGGRSVRDLLQFLGTDMGRRYDPDVWVRKCMGDLHGLLYIHQIERGWLPDLILVDGTRFPNERAAAGALWWVVRPGLDRVVDLHASETSLGPQDADAVLVNEELADFQARVVRAVGRLLRRRT